MFIDLPSGERVEIRVNHGRWSNGQPYRTIVYVLVPLGPYVEDGVHQYVGMSYCHHTDQFDKFTGRKIAVQRVMEDMKLAGYPKEDRKAVFDTVITHKQILKREKREKRNG